MFASRKVVWLYGLPGAGKSTIGDALGELSMEKGVLAVRLDGDALRNGLCRDLGFSPEDRSENLRRAAHLAAFVSKIPSFVIASFITPMGADRDMIQGILGDSVQFVWVKTALAECERRDPKGMYAKARRGEIKAFTGISSPFEEPELADLVCDTSQLSVKESAEFIWGRAGLGT